MAEHDDLRRVVPFELTRSDDDNGDGLTLEGYAAVFDEPTRIDSWEGNFDEVIERGAFAKTIRERTPVLQFDHGTHPMIGSIPLGAIKTLREEQRGLFVRARLSDNWLVQPVRDAIHDGGVTGMSFRFSVVRDEWVDREKDGKVPLRRLKEVRAMELGPVVWPAYTGTSVGVRTRSVLSALDDPDIRREVARALLAPQTDDADSAPPEDGHPEVESRDDAPPVEGHPSSNTDALRDRIRSEAAWMRGYLSLALPKE